MFTPHELTVLEDKFRFTSQENSSSLSIPTIDLLNEKQLKNYLTAIKEKTKAANLGVAASLFVKRYSFSVLIALYTASAHNKKIDFSFDNISVQTLDESDNLWLPSIKFNRINLTLAPQENRKKWIDELLKEIFANHINVLFDQLNKISNLPKVIMWENLYTYIVWMYKNLLDDHDCLNNHQMIKDDFNMITAESKGSLFGKYNENPFLKFRGSRDSQNILEGAAHNRITCCLSYLTESKASFCKTCPIKRKKNQKE